MLVYRISDCRYINDLTGTGAAKFGGRWNSKETYMLYSAQSPSLALLETVVHMGKIPGGNFCLATISLPVDKPRLLTDNDLPPGWQQHPPPDILRKYGDAFIRAGKELAIGVPSVIMPEEYNLLINPHHPDFKAVKVVSQRKMVLDERLKK